MTQVKAFLSQFEKPRAFVRVYRLPKKLTDGYCARGGVPIAFLNVDWFEHLIEDGRDGLEAFIRTKPYVRSGHDYLVLSEHAPFTFTFSATADAASGRAATFGDKP